MPELTTPQQQAELPTPNLPLLRKVLDHIDAHPEEWRQENWAYRTACGTAYCIAGHVAALHGEMVWESYTGRQADYSTDVVLPDGSTVDIGVFAQQQLGLTNAEVFASGDGLSGLFGCFNTREDIQRIAESIAARAGEVL